MLAEASGFFSLHEQQLNCIMYILIHVRMVTCLCFSVHAEFPSCSRLPVNVTERHCRKTTGDCGGRMSNGGSSSSTE